MNEKFFSLSKEKQRRIMNAGFRIFSQNSYKKSPVSKIAEDAGISKALLFHYFHNKKELYTFLWNKAANMVMKRLEEEKCYEADNLFDMMERGIEVKKKIISKYPHLSGFLIRAYFEKDGEISAIIQKCYQKSMDSKLEKLFDYLDPDDYIPGLDLKMMHREMRWTAEGYMWEMLQQGDIDIRKMEKDSRDFLVYYRNVYQNPNKRNIKNKSITKK